MRAYQFNLDGLYFTKELTVNYYNDFLMFTSTIAVVTDTYDDNILSSILLFFSYPNGTDFFLNIFPYFTDSDNHSNNNLIKYLINKCTIDNNIFGYILTDEIKLISIPNEIIFYNEGNNNTLNNGENANINHILKQNNNLFKDNRIYTLDYQCIALGKETNIDVFNQAHEKVIEYQGEEFENDYIQKRYYGRVNRLTFKLCHDYCETCKELGNSNNNQKCISCLPQYQYDYYTYNNYPNISPKNCVPEGYFIGENQKLIECTSSNSKYYFNKTDNNKKIYFDNSNECPDEYPFLIETTNECLHYTHFIAPSLTTPHTAITSTKNYKNNQKKNKTLIDLGTCEYLLKDAYNISYNKTLYILTFELPIEDMKVPKVEYEVYYINDENQLILMNLTYCKNEKIDISLYMPIEGIIDIYNPKSGYYNDLCYTFTTSFGTDISLKDRRQEFIDNNLAICEENCDMKDYNYINKRVVCSCDIKLAISLIEDVKCDKEKLKNNFKDINNIANIKFLKCYKIAFRRKNLLVNFGFYIIDFIFLLYFVFIVLFCSKYQRRFFKKIKKIFSNLSEHIITNNTKISRNKKKKIKNKSKINKKIMKFEKRQSKLELFDNSKNIVELSEKKKSRILIISVMIIY